MQTPHACIHLEKIYVSIGSCQWCPPTKHTFFRFNAPTNNIFPASGTHTCLILRGYSPPSSHTFLAKSKGVNPPLMFIHYQKCRIHPPYSWTSWGRGSTELKSRWQMKPLALFGTVFGNKELIDSEISSAEENYKANSSVNKNTNAEWRKQEDGYYNRKPNDETYFQKYYQEKTK